MTVTKCFTGVIASTENQRWINLDCKIMFAPHILNTIATYLLILKHVNILQPRMLSLFLIAYTCLLLNNYFCALQSCMDMYYFSNTYGTVLAWSLCIILLSTWRYCVHTCTRSGRSCRVLRVNHVCVFLLNDSIRDIYILEVYSFIKRYTQQNKKNTKSS